MQTGCSGRRNIQRCLAGSFAKTLFASCLVFALFGGGSWQLLNFPDDPSNLLLDAIMSAVFFLFLVEIALNLIGDKRYFLSFFFFMDLLGSVSMIFEISFLLGVAGRINTNDTAVDPVFMRTARVAKTAARAGRFLKLTKCVQVLGRGKAGRLQGESAAKMLSHKLMMALSTKVSLLTIALVIIIPVFQIFSYPDEDLSMKAWGQRLEESYRSAYIALQQDPSLTESGIFADVVRDMRAFYSGVAYFPYKLEGYAEHVTLNGGRVAFIPGMGELVDEEVPSRLQNVVKQEVSACLVQRPDCTASAKAAIFFSFDMPKRLEAGLEMAMSTFVIVLMGLLASDLNATVERLVVKPLGRMLAMVREVTEQFLNLVQENDGAEGDSVDATADTPDETLLLEKLLSKLSKISGIALQDKNLSPDEFGKMSDEAKGVMLDIMNVEFKREVGTTELPREASIAATTADRIAKLPMPENVVDSWMLEVLTVPATTLEQVALHIFFDSCVGVHTGKRFAEVPVFRAFYEAVGVSYTAQPYHNFMHANDVLHTVFRLLSLTHAVLWTSDVEQYGLIVAALCHDMGHMGKTNPFLVETGHALALQYNDASPLENMHCASLFRITSSAQTNIFNALSSEQYKTARKVCVATILHTDNAHHFDMVKDINRAYEVQSDIIDRRARVQDGSLKAQYEQEVLKKDAMLYLKLFLHVADVSNPLKPFEMCQAWAWRVLDEFFAQGDEEKRLGIPVGMLNDRDKVSRPGSQHGFINFLVAPLVFGAVKVFPDLHPLSSQMASNLQAWRNVWVREVEPDSEAIEKRDADVRKVMNTAEELRFRTEAPQAEVDTPKLGRAGASRATCPGARA